MTKIQEIIKAVRSGDIEKIEAAVEPRIFESSIEFLQLLEGMRELPYKSKVIKKKCYSSFNFYGGGGVFYYIENLCFRFSESNQLEEIDYYEKVWHAYYFRPVENIQLTRRNGVKEFISYKISSMTL